MSSKDGNRFFRTVTFRLTLRYALMITVVSLVFFWVMSGILTRSLAARMDEDLVSDIKQMEAIYQVQGIEELRRQIDFEIESEGTNRMFIRLMNLSGEVLATSDMGSWGDVHTLGSWKDLREGEKEVETLQIPGKGHCARVISKRISAGEVFLIGCTLEDDEDLMAVYRQGSILAVFVMLLCGSVIGWFMARRAMSGVERVMQTAVSIGKADLVSRVPLGDEGEEINSLAKAFNDMLERIRGVVTELKDVTNNIAHDLRSPITRIRGIAETTMTGEQTIDEYREMAEIVVEESDRLVGMINVMLDIAMTEAGDRGAARGEEVDLGRLIESAYEIFQPVAEDKSVDLRVDTCQAPLVVQGDLSQLQRMISNLLDNAFKFTPPGGSISLSLGRNETHAIVSVADTGFGISEQDLPRIFEQFYRGDRSRTTPGNGLGLSHARAIVRAHGGEIRVESTPGKGSTFRVMFPCSCPRQ